MTGTGLLSEQMMDTFVAKRSADVRETTKQTTSQTLLLQHFLDLYLWLSKANWSQPRNGNTGNKKKEMES